MLPQNWLYKKRYNSNKETGSKTLVKALADAPHESLFSTDLVITLVDQFWANFSKTIIQFGFLPFVLYLIVTLKYFASYISEEPHEFKFRSQETWFRCLIYVFWTYFASHEVMQFISDRIDYFSDYTNYPDIGSAVLNLYLVTNQNHRYLTISDNMRYSLTVLAILLLWVKGLFWLRLFSATSFYIRLITETIKDITYFMIILFIFIAMFANAIYILNLQRLKSEPGSLLVDTYFDTPDDTIWNAFIMQYLLALGDFNFVELFDESSPNGNLVWILFVFATFLTQITILNMLIAIMGDAFARVTEIKV